MTRARNRILIAWPVANPNLPWTVLEHFMRHRAYVEALLNGFSGKGAAMRVARLAERFAVDGRGGRRPVIKALVPPEATFTQVVSAIAAQLNKASDGRVTGDQSGPGGAGRSAAEQVEPAILLDRLVDLGPFMLILDGVHHLSLQDRAATGAMLHALVGSGFGAVVCVGAGLDRSLVTKTVPRSRIPALTGSRILLYHA
ncbi:hypothetical protein [Actinoplanes sp. NPDC026670]|uniref:hypothetical protein n=1 Tax=Actinoplanes sp. NPDC026670 TaxID=3154700 RepID=UPI0033E8B39C